MGKIITFWSPFPGQAKVTASMCAVAVALAMQHPELEVALSHTQQDSCELEERMDFRICSKDKKSLYEKTGVSALALNYMQAVLTSDKIRRCGIPLINKSLYIFPGMRRKEGLEEVQYHILTEKLVQEFDLTFLDLTTGEQEDSLRYMLAADLVVIVLPQRPECWKAVCKQYIEKLEGKELCFVLGGYLKNSKFNSSYFNKKKEFGTRGKLLGVVPVNVGYMDAMAEGRTVEFLLKNEYVGKKDENYEFVDQTKKTAEHLRRCVNGEKDCKLFYG